MNDLDKLSEYNNNNNMNLLVTISAIEFFKQTFRIKLELNSILEGIPKTVTKMKVILKWILMKCLKILHLLQLINKILKKIIQKNRYSNRK